MKQIAEPTFYAVVKSEKCNDIVRLSVIVDGDATIVDIGAEVYGCGYSIAGASLLNECAKMSRMEEVENKFEQAVELLINDVPERNRYCIHLAFNAFKKIYEQYDNLRKQTTSGI